MRLVGWFASIAVLDGDGRLGLLLVVAAMDAHSKLKARMLAVLPLHRPVL